MRKGTIFKYEIKQLLCSREYLLLLAAVIAYCVLLLRSSVMVGALYTAPFSQWTFCDYLSSVMVLLLALLLVLCARQFTPARRGAMAIIGATPMPAPVFRAIQYGAIACAFGVAATASALVCFGFYALVFDYTAFGGLIASGLLLVLPPALLALGAAMLLGSKKPAFVYALLAAVLIIGVFGVSLPAWIDVIGGSVTQPLYEGVHTFAFTPGFIAGRIAFTMAGITCIVLSVRLPRSNPPGKAKPA